MQRLNTLLPVLAAGIALVTDWAIPDSSLHPAANRPYFLLVMAVALALTAVLFLAGFAAPAFQKKYSGKAPFYTGILLFLCVLNILTAKTATLPVLYFPSLDRVFGVLVEDAAFLGKCLALLPAPASDRLGQRCGGWCADRRGHWLQQGRTVLDLSSGPGARPYPFHRLDPPGNDQLPHRRLRQRLSHRPGRLVPHQRADGQRHLQHPQRLL